MINDSAHACWLYLAVSSSKQEDSLEDQESWARSAALANGWTILRTFRGVSSGAQGVRKLLEDLLTELRTTPKRERPERVLMIRVDRLGRGDGLEAIAAISEIRRLGVTIHTRQDGDLKIERATDALVPALRSITGALENEARSEKSRAMHARKKAAGEVQGRAPYGFRVENHYLAPSDPQAAFVIDLFRRRAQGWGILRLASYARSHAPGVTRKWSGSSIRTILVNPKYRSVIVPDALFDDVQAVANVRPPRAGVFPWPLRGAVKCVCGLRLVTRPSGRGRHITRYYFCYDAHRHGSHIGHRADALERQFLELLDRLRAHPEIADTAAPADGDGLSERLSELERERGDLARQRERVWDMFNRKTVAEIELGRRLTAIAAEEARVAQSIADVQQSSVRAQARARRRANAAEVLAQGAEAWPSADVDAKQRFARDIALYVGGLWADPNEPGVLLYGPR